MILTNAVITAYCACTICCGPKASGLAANGKPPVQGVTVAGSRVYPLGTKVTIAGLTNNFIINDRLATRYDKRFDIYFTSHKQALKWGKQQRTVIVHNKQ